MIIDYLFSDKTTLASCSLVCRDWLQSSRYHLFARISLFKGSDLREDDGKWIHKFIAFLNKSPPVVGFVQELYLSSTQRPPTSALCSIKDVHWVASMLPSLHTIATSALNLSWHEDFSPEVLQPILLTHLRISNLAFSKTTLHSLLYLFSPAGTLRITQAVLIRELHDEIPVDVPFSVQARSITVDDRAQFTGMCISQLITDYLTSHMDYFDCSWFSIVGSRTSSAVLWNMRNLHRTLARADFQLRYLRIDISWVDLLHSDPDDLRASPETQGISKCLQLHTLHLTIFLTAVESTGDTEMQFTHMVILLSAAPKSLRHVIIGIRELIAVDDQSYTDDTLKDLC